MEEALEVEGLEELVDRPPIHKSHPMTTPKHVEEKILEACLAHPSWGCERISKHLELEGVSCSAPTVQKILRRNGLVTAHDRYFKLREKVARQHTEFSREQLAFVRDLGFNLQWQQQLSTRPGEILNQGFFLLRGGNNRKVYLHAVVDVYSRYAFGALSEYEVPDTAVALLHNKVVPFYRQRGLSVVAIVTGCHQTFRGAYEWHCYINYIDSQDIVGCYTPNEKQASGCVKHFYQTAYDEFFRAALKEPYRSLDLLQSSFDDWLRCYNAERSLDGYPNMGRRPIDMIDGYLRHVREGKVDPFWQNAKRNFYESLKEDTGEEGLQPKLVLLASSK